MNEVAADTDIWGALAPQLTSLQQKFPLEAVQLAEAHWDEVAPQLAAALERIAADPEPARDGHFMLHLFAAHLLAQHRDPRAHAPLLRLARLPEDALDDLFGSIVTESLGRLLASTCNGDEGGLRALVEDESAGIWARIAGFDALVTRVLEGDAAREATLEYLAGLGAAEQARLAADAERAPLFLTSVVNAAVDIGAAPLLPQIRKWFADGLIDEMIVDLHFVEVHAHDDIETLRRFGRHCHYVRSAVEEMQDWAFEQPPRPASAPHFDPEINRYGEPLRLPHVRETPKVGRNDPCPCGSGRKYKRCCGA